MNYDPNDLLSQIAAPDEVSDVPEKKKKQRSISIDFAVLFMKLTFAFDDAKRKNQTLFTLLGILWNVFMGIVYLGGIAMLGLLIYSYGTFPDKVRETLITQGIITKGYEIDNISLSKIELKNLEDKDGTYSIKKMIIHSTFSDFIRGRVKSVELDGVKMKITEDKDGVRFGNLPASLIKLNQASAQSRIKVSNLQINNAQLEINGTNYSVPVSFHLNGAYEDEAKVVMDLTIRKEHVKINGVLSVTGTEQKMDFNLKIGSGTLELPQRSPENIVGEMTVTTKKMEPEKIVGHVTLSYGENNKKINLSLTKNTKSGFNGTVSVNVVQGKSSAGQAVNSNISADFSELQFKTPYVFSTQKPIKLKIAAFKTSQVNLSNVTATLNGQLDCDHFNCTYQIQKASPVFARELSLLFQNDTIKSSEEVSFSLQPNQKQTFVYTNNDFVYNMKIASIVFSGYRNTSVTPISLTAGTTHVDGQYHLINQSRKMKLNTEKVNLSTPEITLNNMTFKRANVFDDKSVLLLTADRVEITQNDLLRAPFKLSLEKTGVGLDTKAQMTIENVVRVSFAGVGRLLTGEFSGNIHIPEFDLSAVKTPLTQISSLFPAGISDVSGKVAVLGRINFKNAKQVTGPLFVSLKDIGFALKNEKVSGLNTVLLMQTVSPLLSAPNQKVFIAEATGAVPFQNLMADIKLDNQFLKVTSANLTLAGIPFSADSAFVSLKSDNAALHLKNNAVSLTDISKYLNLDGAVLTGKSAVTVTLELDKGLMALQDGDIKISGAELALDKVQDGKIKKYFTDSKTYIIRSGTLFVDSNIADDTVNMNVSLDGRLSPAGKIKNIRETIVTPLKQLVKPVEVLSVPEDIVRKQQAVSR